MGFRFNKRITLFPGVRLNLGLGGASMSVGPRGASVTVGKRGVHANVGIPGSGLSYRTRLDKASSRAREAEAALEAPEPRDTIDGREVGPEVPKAFTLRLEGPVMTFLDADNNPFDDEATAIIRKAYRSQLIPALEARVVHLDQVLEEIADIHSKTPMPADPTPAPQIKVEPFSVPKPQRPADPELVSDFMQRLSDWTVARAAHETDWEGRGRADIESVAGIVIERLSGVTWPRETNIEVDLDDSGTILSLNVDLPEIEDLPAVRHKTNSRTVMIDAKPISGAEIARLYARHVHGVLFRIAGEAFAAHGCIANIRLGAYTQRLSPATGRSEDVYVVTAGINRGDWQAIDFSMLDTVDPVLAFERFSISRNMKARGDLLPVPKPE